MLGPEANARKVAGASVSDVNRGATVSGGLTTGPGRTVIDTVATFDPEVPSLPRNVKESAPEKPAAGV